MKVCVGCKQEKGFDKFYKASARKDGLQSRCKDCSKEFRRNWQKTTEKGKAYVERNRSQVLARDPEYWKKDYDARYATEEGRQKYFDNAARRRAVQLGAEGHFTRGEFKRLCEHYGNVCLKCGASGVPLEADHIMPLSKGGSNDITNIQPLCKACNSKKRANYADYRPDFGFEKNGVSI